MTFNKHVNEGKSSINVFYDDISKSQSSAAVDNQLESSGPHVCDISIIYAAAKHSEETKDDIGEDRKGEDYKDEDDIGEDDLLRYIFTGSSK